MDHKSHLHQLPTPPTFKNSPILALHPSIPNMPQPTQQIPPKSFIIKTDKPRPHICITCTRSFARLEHLKRHERSHTKEKPFQCPVCERCFARRDLLLRHKQKLHASFPETPRVRATAKRKSVSATKSAKNAPSVVAATAAAATAAAAAAAAAATANPTGSIAQKPPTPIPEHPPQQSPLPLPSSMSPLAMAAPPDTSRPDLPNNSHSTTFIPPSLTSGFHEPKDSNLTEQQKVANRMRSASFSATSATSYSKFKDIVVMDAALPPSGPNQVGFATPQLHPAAFNDQDLQGDDQLFNSNDLLFINPQLLDPSFDDFFLGNSAAPATTSSEMQNSPTYVDSLLVPNEDISWLNSKDYSMNFNTSQSPTQILDHLPATNPTDDFSPFPEPLQNSLFNFDQFNNSPSNLLASTPADPDLSSIWAPQSSQPGSSLYAKPSIAALSSSPRSHIITPRLRLHILTTLSVPTPFTSNQPPHLPSTPELQLYVDAYISHFAMHLPFLHHTLEFSTENAPLALSMAAIGALYLFERSDSASIFEVSRCCVHVYLESRRERKVDQKTGHDTTPLWLVQTLILGVIYGLFNEEPLANEIAVAQAKAVISLAKSAGLQTPPRTYIKVPDPNSSTVQEKWDYFVKVQERIRTMHVIHTISCLLATGYNEVCSLKNSDIRCGSPCDERLWSAKSANDWWAVLQKKESDGSLGNAIEGPDFLDCLNRLLSGNTLVGEIPQFTLLTLIYAIHLDIHQRRIEYEQRNAIAGINGSNEGGSPTNTISRDPTQWLDGEKRRVEAVLRAWETTWSLSPHASLIPRTQEGSLMSDSIPMSSLAHVRLYLDLRKAKECFWKRDFVGMGRELDQLQTPIVFEVQSGARKQFNALLEAASYAADTISLWEKHSARWTLQGTATQTFIHNILALFDCGLLVSEFFFRLEKRDRSTWQEDERQLVLRLRKIFFRVFDVLTSRADSDVLHNQLERTGQAVSSPFYDTVTSVASAASAAPTPAEMEHHRYDNTNGNNESLSEYGGLFPQQKELQSPLSIMALNAVSQILATIYIWPFAVVMAQALNARIRQIRNVKTRDFTML